MATKAELESRIAELEADLRQRDERNKELRDDQDRMRETLSKMREHLEDHNAVIDDWVEAFRLEQGDDGNLHWTIGPGDIVDSYNELLGKYRKLRRDHNKLVREWNAHFVPVHVGRPLNASADQIDEVRRLRKNGLSLRAIAETTGLGFQTVRTIVGKDNGTDRTSKREAESRKRELDRLRQAAWRERKRQLDQLPGRIVAIQRDGKTLIKAAKGLDD